MLVTLPIFRCPAVLCLLRTGEKDEGRFLRNERRTPLSTGGETRLRRELRLRDLRPRAGDRLASKIERRCQRHRRQRVAFDRMVSAGSSTRRSESIARHNDTLCRLYFTVLGRLRNRVPMAQGSLPIATARDVRRICQTEDDAGVLDRQQLQRALVRRPVDASKSPLSMPAPSRRPTII